jgi:hypothetical protein
MASGSKKKTTMAKLNREAAVRERRLRKEARKAARKNAPAGPGEDDSIRPDDGTSADRDQV